MRSFGPACWSWWQARSRRASWPLTLTLYASLKLVATGTPFAVLLSLMVRFFARRILRLMQRHGRSLRHVLVVGSFGAAQQLSERIQQEPDAGMKVIGLCLPSSQLPRAVVAGIPVLGSLHQVPRWSVPGAVTPSR